MKFNGVEITKETIASTREWFASNAQACITEVLIGEVTVNDQESYFMWQAERMIEANEGKYDHTFAFQQRAHTIQTGECIPLFA